MYENDIHHHSVAMGCLLSLIAFLLYANTLNHGFVLDDTNLITDNVLVKQGVGAVPELLRSDYRAGTWKSKATLYRPLSLVMFAVEWQLFPNNPFPGHLINVLLYGLTAYLLFAVLQQLLPGGSLLIPFSTALLFIVHPIHTEVVANIKSRDEILSFLFVLGSLYLALMPPTLGRLLAAAALYFLSLMSKESSITIAAVVPIMLYFFRKRRAKTIALTTGVFAGSASLYLVLRKLVLGEVAGLANVSPVDNFLVLAKDLNTKAATVAEILGKYLRLLFFPHPLSSDYSFNQIPIVTWSNWASVFAAAVYIGLLAVLLVRIRKKELWAFGIAFYLTTISLYTNIFITIGAGFGERFLYVPSLGFCIAVVALLAKTTGTPC
jgi:protein O-mannosyl-transferase